MIREFHILDETASSHHRLRKMVLPYPPTAGLHRYRMDLVVWCPQLRVLKSLSCFNVLLSTVPGSHCTGHTSQESIRNPRCYHPNSSKGLTSSQGVTLITLIILITLITLMTVNGPFRHVGANKHQKSDTVKKLSECGRNLEGIT